MRQSRPYAYPEIALVLTVRKSVLSFVLGLMATVGVVVLITPGRTLDFVRGKTGTAALGELIDTQKVVSITSRPPNDVQSTDVLAHATLQIAGGSRESSSGDERACDDAMLSSLKGRCLSFAKRKKHRRKAIESAIYFAAH
jgi:hypothetical protein